MAKTYNRMRIDVNGDILSGVTAIAQDTQSRYLDVSLYNNGVPLDLTGEVVRIYVKKPDGTVSFEQGEITDAVNGRCQFELTNQMLAVAGDLQLQISVWSSDAEILSTKVFKIYVSDTLRIDEAVESTNEFGVLVVLFQEIQDALDTMKGIKDTFGEPGEMAAEYGADTFWKMLETLASNADVASVIEKLVNSTVGTDDFKTIDKIIEKAENKVDTVIDTLLDEPMNLYDGSITFPEVAIRNTEITVVDTAETLIDTFTVNDTGIYCFYVSGKRTSGTSYVYFYVNGRNTETVSFTSTSYGTKQSLLQLNAGDRIEVKMKASGSTYIAYCNSITYYFYRNSTVYAEPKNPIGTYDTVTTFLAEYDGDILITNRYTNDGSYGRMYVNDIDMGLDGSEGVILTRRFTVEKGKTYTFEVGTSNSNHRPKTDLFIISYDTRTLENHKIIKSVQRGIVSADGDVMISDVNPMKCTVSISGSEAGIYCSSTTDAYRQGGYIEDFKKDVLTIKGTHDLITSWEVVEYY